MAGWGTIILRIIESYLRKGGGERLTRDFRVLKKTGRGEGVESLLKL